MQLRSSVPALLAALMVWSCGGSSSSSNGGDAGPDGSGSDAGVDATVDAPSEAAPQQDATDSDGAGSDATLDALSEAAAQQDATGTDSAADGGMAFPEGGVVHPCQLPGSVQFTSTGTVTVPGGSSSWPSLSFLHLPSGFCAHYFGNVGNARQLRFAPGGDAFVASPTTITTGGGQGGAGGIVVLPDADLDGVADGNVAYITGVASTQGMLFANGHLYYQDGTKIERVAYTTGDRSPSGTAEQVANITGYASTLHWPKTLDVADDGTIYVGNGGDQSEACVTPHPFHGGIFKIDPAPGGSNPGGAEVAKGLRNPINVRCRHGSNTCFALELGLDYSGSQGGREKLIPIRQGDDWGFPCCATTNLPYSGGATDCSTVATDTDSFKIGDTPFGIDFEPGFWTGPWAAHAFVATHGAAGSWVGARIVAIPVDGATGIPAPATDVDGGDSGMVDFATGWDDGTLGHGRPAAVTFSPDGRLFVASDTTGVIFWIASLSQ